MQQYFCQIFYDDTNTFELESEDFHHITRVMRLGIGDEIRVIFDKKPYLGKIQSLDNQTVIVEKVTVLDEIRELPQFVSVALGLLKGDKFDYALQKMTELGAAEIIPWQAQYSVVKIEEKKASKKAIRWQTICKEASEQSRRHQIPEVMNPITLANIMKIADQYDKILVCYEQLDQDRQYTLLNAINIDQDKKILIVVGPEGGISEKEIAALKTISHVNFVSLGSRILRAETAAISAMAVVAAISDR